MKIRQLTLLLLCLTNLSYAEGGNWSLGAGALRSANPYQDTKNDWWLIPMISYQSPYISLYGPFARLRYPTSPNHIFGASFQLGLQTFDPSDSSHPGMQKLNKRKRLYFVGPFYQFRSTYGDVITELSADITGNSKSGMTLSLSYEYPWFNHKHSLFLRPNVGLTWFNQAMTRYYYQVTPTESQRSGLTPYAPSSTLQPYAGIFSSIQLTKKLYWTNVINIQYLPKTIRHSPMVGHRYTSYVFITALTFEIGDESQRFNH